MSRQHHSLKCETEYYQAIEQGLKRFELRKNDRDFKKYDMVKLVEVVNEKPSGRVMEGFEIIYIFKGVKYGLKEGYCILQLKHYCDSIRDFLNYGG